MIKGVHTMFYSSDAAGMRKFIKEKLGFNLLMSAMDGSSSNYRKRIWDVILLMKNMERHLVLPDISFYCDDIHATCRRSQSKGS
jgi:hypothetical protein